MSFNQFGSNPSATFGTYNDIARDQTITTIQGTVNVQEINVFNRDSNVHGALIRELRDKPNPSIFVGNDRPQCLENTRKGTLQSIYNWVETEGCPNVLLLIGAAGTGKSTIATTVAGVYQRRRQLGCHMFFVRERSHPGNVLQTIAYLLAEYSHPIAETLSEQLKKSGNLDSSNLKAKFDILLQQPLSAVATKLGHPVIIVLDALDECGTPDERQSLLDVLLECLLALPANFRVLITSRPEEDITPLISSPNFQTMRLNQHSDESKDNVYTYIKSQFDKMKSSRKLRVPDDCDWDNSIQTLSESADGLFIWASTAIRFVEGERSSRYRCF